MVDPPRGGSMPPQNQTEDVVTLLNPAYSGSVAASDGVQATNYQMYSSSRQEIVEMEIEASKPPETATMKRIKIFLIILFILIAISTLFNVAHFVAWISERESSSPVDDETLSDFEVILDFAALYDSGNMTEETLPTEISSTTSTTDAPTTSITESTTTSTSTEPPTTTLDPREDMKDAYRNFTERFNRTYSEAGLDNYVYNSYFFPTDTSTFADTQFADLSETQLRKLVNTQRDPRRGDTSKRCDIHTYYGDEKREARVEGSSLYGANDRVPSRVDLRRRGIIGAVRNQGTTCNAGYSFAVTSLLESKVDTNGSRLSVQMLLADDYNHHCEGGETFRAMESVQHSGIVTETVLPYDESQHWHDIDDNATRYDYAQACLITKSHREALRYRDPNDWYSWINIPASDVPASTYIKHFLAKLGTVVVEVPVDHAFFFYKSGHYAPDCNAILGYHPAIVIGYGLRNGVNVWILRNSFGTDWGIDGDFEMARDSSCGAFDYAFTFYKSV